MEQSSSEANGNSPLIKIHSVISEVKHTERVCLCGLNWSDLLNVMVLLINARQVLLLLPPTH